MRTSTYEPSSSLASITSISPGKFSFAASTTVSRFARNGCSWSPSITYLPNSRVLLNVTSFSAVDTMTVLNRPLSVLPLASATSGSGLDEAHKMALGVGEHRDARAVRQVHRLHHPAPTETLDLAQRRLEVPDLHVESDVPLASFRRRADAAVDAALNSGVCHRVVWARGLHLPVEGVPVEGLEGLGVLTYDLGVHYRVTHKGSDQAPLHGRRAGRGVRSQQTHDAKGLERALGDGGAFALHAGSGGRVLPAAGWQEALAFFDRG